MIYFFCFLGWSLTVWCWRRKQELDRTGDKKSSLYLLLKNSLTVLAPFTGVAILFLLLSLWVNDVDNNSTTFETLYRFESGLRFVRPFAALFKPAPWVNILALSILLALAAFSFRKPSSRSVSERKSSRIARWQGAGFKIFISYSKAVATAYITIALLCSFSFFANKFEPGMNRLELRLAKMEADLVQLGARIEQELEASVQEEILRQILAQAPPSLAQARNDTSEFLQRTARLRSEYNIARTRLGIGEPLVLTEALRKEERLRRALDSSIKVAESQTAQTRTAASPQDGVTSRLSGTDLAEAINSLERVQMHRTEQAVALLESEPRKKLTGTLLGKLLNAKQIGVVENALQEIPFAELILDIFQKTLVNLVEQKVENRIFNPYVERLREIAIGPAPSQLEAAVQREAARLVADHGRIAESWLEFKALRQNPAERYQAISSEWLGQAQRAEEGLKKAIHLKQETLLSRRKAVLARLELRVQELVSRSFQSASQGVPAPDGYSKEGIQEYLETEMGRWDKADVSTEMVENLEKMESRLSNSEVTLASAYIIVARIIGRRFATDTSSQARSTRIRPRPRPTRPIVLYPPDLSRKPGEPPSRVPRPITRPPRPAPRGRP